MVEFVQNLSLFNTQPERTRASTASLKHVGQVLNSRGFKFGENGPIKISTVVEFDQNFLSFQHTI